MHRRRFAQLAAGLLAGMEARTALAQDPSGYPGSPIRIVVGFPPGQASDIIARMIAAKLGEELKQSVFVDNKPGAAGIIAHQWVKDARPDGHTLLIGSTATLAVNPVLYRKLPYDPVKDFAPVTQLSATPMYLVAHLGTPVGNLREMVEYVRARPGKLSYASAGSGTSSHIVMEMLKKLAGLDLTHVPFKGSPNALTSLMAGEVQFGFEISSAILPHAAAGKVKLLATSAAERTAQFPKVPTLVEEGLPDFVFTPWSAMLAPAGTPTAVIDKLNAAVNRALRDKDMVAYSASTGSVIRGGTAAQLQQFIRSETTSWGNAVRTSGAQVD